MTHRAPGGYTRSSSATMESEMPGSRAIAIRSIRYWFFESRSWVVPRDEENKETFWGLELDDLFHFFRKNNGRAFFIMPSNLGFALACVNKEYRRAMFGRENPRCYVIRKIDVPRIKMVIPL